jgi:cytochrome b561
METKAPQFGPVAVVLHWMIAAGVLAALALGWSHDLVPKQFHGPLLSLHKSFGLAVFALTWARLFWRLTHAAPPYPWPMPAWQRLAAHATHFLLYVATLALPISGYISVAARGRDTTFFGLVAVPQWVPLDRQLAHVAGAAHAVGQWALYALLTAHIGATLFHHLVQRHRLLQRMWMRRTLGTPEPAAIPGE